MNFNIKKQALRFFGFWGILLLVSYLTESRDMEPVTRVVVAGVLALFIWLLCLIGERGNAKKDCYTVRKVGDSAVFWRVEGEWIYTGSEEKASHYIKRGKVYSFDSTKPLFRLADGKIYREGEAEPILAVRDDRICSCLTGQEEYIIQKVEEKAKD